MTPDAIVIGGGFAGLSAAVALTQAGARVCLFEARPSLGGRASSFADPRTGDAVDNGQHVLLGCYRETLCFLDIIGASDSLHRPSGLRAAMIEEDGTRTTFACPPLPPPMNLAAGLLAWDALDWRERLTIRHTAGDIRRAGRALANGVPLDPRFSTITVAEWLTECRQGSRVRLLFWEPLAVAALNQPLEVATADMFLAVLARMVHGDANAAAIYLPALPLTDFYAEPARRWLESRGATVRTGARAKVACTGRQLIGASLRGEIVTAPAVVLAVPWGSFAGCFDEIPAGLEDTARHAAALGSSPIVTVNLWFDRAFDADLMLGLPGRTFQWAFDKTAVFGSASAHVSLVSSAAGTIVRESNEALIARAHRELTGAVPQLAGARVLRAIAVRERAATFSLAPGQPPRPATRTAIRGLVLAGDWIATGLPATIESAVAAGHMAAAALQGDARTAA